MLQRFYQVKDLNLILILVRGSILRVSCTLPNAHTKVLISRRHMCVLSRKLIRQERGKIAPILSPLQTCVYRQVVAQCQQVGRLAGPFTHGWVICGVFCKTDCAKRWIGDISWRRYH